jgi:hypothetical protein
VRFVTAMPRGGDASKMKQLGTDKLMLASNKKQTKRSSTTLGLFSEQGTISLRFSS